MISMKLKQEIVARNSPDSKVKPMESLKLKEIPASFPETPGEYVFNNSILAVSTTQLQALSVDPKLRNTSTNIN